MEVVRGLPGSKLQPAPLGMSDQLAPKLHAPHQTCKPPLRPNPVEDRVVSIRMPHQPGTS